MDVIAIVAWILIFIGEFVIASAILSTAKNTEAILKLLKDELASQKYKEWKERQSG